MGTGQGGATDAEGSIARAHNQGKKTDDSEEEGTQATMTHQPETATAEASGERETAPSHAASNSLATEEETTGTSEGFSPPTTNSRHEDVVSSLWEKDAIGPDVFGGRQQGNDNAVPAGERCLDADASQASHAPPSRVVGAGTATGAWSAGETDAMPGQQEEDGKGMRQDAEWWDWEDPWGQEAAWGAPAFGVGTGGTQPFHHDDAVPTPDALPEGDVHSLAQPLGGNEGGSGWKVVSGQIEVGVQCTETSTLGDPDAVTVASRRKELEELAQALTETRKELEDAREVEKALRSALREQEEARASAAAAAAAVAEQAEAADALVKQRAEEAKENATAVGQLLLTLGLEQQNLKEQLAAAQSSSTLLTKELEDLREVSRKAEHRASSSEAKLKVALEDVAVLDEGLKQYMDGDGQQISSRPSPALWRRVSEAYLRPLLPSKLKTPSPEELEVVKLNRSLGRALENNTALAEAVRSKDDLVKDLNSRIKQFQLQAVRRKKGYHALKLGLADLTREVEAKESMVIIMVVAMVRAGLIMDQMSAAIRAQREALESLASLSRVSQENVDSLSLEVEQGTSCLAKLQESLHKADSAMCAIANSLGAGEACVQRWKDATDQEISENMSKDSLMELVRELQAAATNKFVNPLGLEPTTGAITVAVPRTVSGQTDIHGVVRRQRTFWMRLVDAICCRRHVEE
ncbi:unnamed protein product [Ascophyllum nodosum]